MHHIIYVPREHITGITVEEHLTSVGLADHVQGAQTTHANEGGPDGKGGELFGWSNRLHFNADEQEWTPAVVSGDLPAGRYWVGTFKASPPTEADLRRPYRFGGKLVQLGDGQNWLVPTPEELPHTARLADDGTWRFVVQRRFHDYYLRAMTWVEEAATNGGANLTLYDMIAFSVEALSLNYRIAPELVSSLGLLDQVIVAKAWSAATGLEFAKGD